MSELMSDVDLERIEDEITLYQRQNRVQGDHLVLVMLPTVMDEVRRLRAQNAAIREIVVKMAQLDLEYSDEQLEFFCPACGAFVSADWGTGRKPYGMTAYEWAAHRMKHEPDCPVTKALALVAQWKEHESE